MLLILVGFKYDTVSSKLKYICKARLWVYDGLDYSDIFNPVAKLASARTLLSVAV